MPALLKRIESTTALGFCSRFLHAGGPVLATAATEAMFRIEGLRQFSEEGSAERSLTSTYGTHAETANSSIQGRGNSELTELLAPFTCLLLAERLSQARRSRIDTARIRVP